MRDRASGCPIHRRAGAEGKNDVKQGDRRKPKSVEGAPARLCANCGSPTEAGAACGECGYSLDAPDSVPVWEEAVWEVVARPDRAVLRDGRSEDMEFPATTYTRRLPLVGDHVRIGRRSASKGIQPEIDLSGSLEDLGVSHRHAVLMRQPDGSWALVDQGSTNGTFLNTEHDPIPANQRLPLQAGDQIHIGAWTTLTMERVDIGVSRSHEVSVPSKDTRGVVRGRQHMEIRLLGPLQATVGGTPVTLGAPKLTRRTGPTGAADRVSRLDGRPRVERVGDKEPTTADKALQGYVSTLRQSLGAELIETTPQGYRLRGTEGSGRHIPLRTTNGAGSRAAPRRHTRGRRWPSYPGHWNCGGGNRFPTSSTGRPEPERWRVLWNAEPVQKRTSSKADCNWVTTTVCCQT